MASLQVFVQGFERKINLNYPMLKKTEKEERIENFAGIYTIFFILI